MSDEKTRQDDTKKKDDSETVDPNTDANADEVTTDDNTTPTTHRNRTGITSVTSDAGSEAEGGSDSDSK